MKRIAAILFLTVLVASGWAIPVSAAGGPSDSDEDLALMYAPVFYFHPAEVFRPQPVDVIVEQARLRQQMPVWFDVTVQVRVAVSDLLELAGDERHFLDVWYGDEGGSGHANYSAHETYYRAKLSPEAGGPDVTVYAHVVRDQASNRVAIQYWALYYYNDWFNLHEGDWEMVQVILGESADPEWVVLSQHHGGTRRAWSSASVEDGTHPAVYVARGSHANYFVGNEVYPQGQDVGRTRLEIFDRTGTVGRVIPSIVMLPDRAQIEANPEEWPDARWLLYRGRWGQNAVQDDFGGPTGPADKGEQWEDPFAWGLAQPLDTDVWYGNRLRVEVVGDDHSLSHVHLTGGAEVSVASAEELDGLAILHEDPPASIVAVIATRPRAVVDVVAVWPDASTDTVTRYEFRNVRFSQSGSGNLEMSDGAPAKLVVHGAAEGGADLELSDPLVDTVNATWDAPDLVWIGGALPAYEVGAGILLAVLGGVLPTIGYVAVLYWADRYEREPLRLLATAFVWGAVPSVLLALVADLFFRLPLNLIGTRALEAARLGILAPVLQEALKGIAVAFIAWRYRDEFNGVLDGIVYGATVGFGFAMTGNLIGNVGRFVQWGQVGLTAGAMAEGIIWALDQALYSAMLGAGLGLATRFPSSRVRWLVRAGAFAAAAITHLVHNLLAAAVVGLNVFSVLLTLIGAASATIVIIWSLRRQHRLMREWLLSEVPRALYETLTVPGRRTRAEWQSLGTGGLKGLRLAKRRHRLAAELAFALSHADLRTDDPDAQQTVARIRAELQRVAGDGADQPGPAT